MITLDEMIKNEMELALEHAPTEEELQSLSAWLATCDIKYLINLDLEISKWCKAKTVQCAWCGHRYLPTEMVGKHESGEYFCDYQCKTDYETDHGGY